MVVRNDGFLVLRRDSTAKPWSQENGAQDAEVEIFDSLAASGRPVPLSEAVFADLVCSGQGAYRSNFNRFGFAGYLLVPDAGIDVS